MNTQKWQNLAVILVLIVLIANALKDRFSEFQTINQTSNKQIAMPFADLHLPENLDFCGEKVPLQETDVAEKLDRELVANVHAHSSTILIMKRANRWFGQMEKILKEHDIPEDFKYLVVIESALQNEISPAGATGFWQFMKETALEIGLEINEEVDERYDPIKATKAACIYIKNAHRKLGNWTNVAASYNMGIAGVKNALEEQQVTSYYDLYLNPETTRYVFRALALKEIMENPEKYHFEISEKNLYKPLKTKTLTVNKTIEDLIAFALEQKTTYKNLKIYNPWLRKKSLTVKDTTKKYEILLPE
ncbi:MAG: lytic transglycosylase domain-containing protein [Bacteroidetes bacterium]|nr:MAG: lytic transglycosylase domain-containing protein [Bacteroidota bacterium]